MQADWSVELGGEAAALELPWSDPSGLLLYVDLRAAAARGELQAALAQIPEARQWTALDSFLQAANAPQGLWMSAKCDALCGLCDPWENEFRAPWELSGYVDLLFAGALQERRLSRLAHEQAARALARALDEQGPAEAVAEIVVRHCFFHPSECPTSAPAAASQNGYCLTLFLTAWGSGEQEACARWSAALEAAACCLSRWQPQSAEPSRGEVG
jgi:hypothetical protein